MKAYLDDMREPPTGMVRYTVPHHGLLESELISFDHDLGDCIWTGYDVLKALIVLGWRGKVRVHSANPVGAERLRYLAREFGLLEE